MALVEDDISRNREYTEIFMASYKPGITQSKSSESGTASLGDDLKFGSHGLHGKIHNRRE